MTGATLKAAVRFAAWLLAGALLAPAAQAQWTPSGVTGQSTAPVSDRGKAMALAAGARVLVVGHEDKRLSVIDPDTGSVLRQTLLPDEPRALAVSSDGTRAYVVYGNSKLTAVDLAAGSVIATWSVGGELKSVVLMPGEIELAVADAGPNRLLEVNTTSGAVLRQLPLAHEPRELLRANGDSKLVVGAVNGWLITVDGGSFSVLAQLKLADEIRALAWWEAGARALAVHRRVDAVSLFDIGANQVTGSVALDGDPDRAAVSQSSSVGYIATHDDASVNRVDLAGPALLGRYAIAARLNALVFDPVANVLYGALRSDQKLVRLDPAAASLISVLELRKRLRDVAVNPTTHEAVAVADKSDEMFVIKLSDRSVRTIGLPARPDLVAVDHGLNRALVAFRGSGPKLRFADLVSNTLFAETVAFDRNLNAIAVDSTRALALAIADGERPVLFIDTNSRARLADGPADRYRALAIHSGRGVAYLATEGRELKVMDLATRAITATLELGFKANAIAVDEALDKAVITTDSGNNAHVLNLATLALEANHTLPKHPGALALQPDTHVAVIASRESDKLSLLDLTTNTLTPGFTSVDKPHALAVSARYNEALVLSGERDEVAFVQLPNPVPVLESLSPSEASAGSAAFVLTINGKGFIEATRAFFGSTQLATRWVSATRLEADVTAALLAAAATVPVTVQNPAPGGGASNALLFGVVGAPVLNSIAPDTALADGQPKSLTLSGQNFVAGASVLFGPTVLPADVQSSTSVAVTVPGGLTGTPGTVQVSVVNPGGFASNSVPFTLTPNLAIAAFSPAQGPVGTAVAISGTGFDPNLSGNQVKFNGEPAVIVSGSATLLNVIVPPRATTGAIAVSNLRGTAASTTPFTVQEREAFDITLAPASIQVPPGGHGGTRIRLSSTGLNPYPYGASVAVTGLPAGVTAAFDRPMVALNLDSLVSFSAAAGVSAGTFNVTLTATGASGVTTQTVTKTLNLQVLLAGSTTVTGRVFHADDDAPFVGARVRLGGQAVFTDETGTYRFVNPTVLGDQVLLIDGNTNNTAEFEYPSGIAMPVMILAGQDNKVLTSYVGRIDAARFTSIVPGQPASVTDPDIPNFSLNVPAGATIFGWDGQPVTKINVRKVPVDRLPIRPIPDGQTSKSVYLFYFFREGGGDPTTPIPVTLPNDGDALPGEQVELWYYDESRTPDPSSNQWRFMGMGTVSADGKSIVSNPGVGIPKFCCGAVRPRFGSGGNTGGNGGNGGGPNTPCPVNLASGNALVFTPRPFGMSVLMPVNPNCQYRSTDGRVRLFGRGMSFTYEWFAEAVGSEAIQVTNPHGVRFMLSRDADGVFRSRSGRSLAIEMEIFPTPSGRTLRMADGMQYEFNSAGQLIAIVDLAGNRTTFQLDGQGFPTGMIDAAGKSYSFTRQGTNPPLITRITDPAGRFVEFGYDSLQRLDTYRDQGGGVTTFEYDASNRITKKTDPRGAIERIEYDAAGRAIRELLPENGVQQFAYNVAGTVVTQTTHTDENGSSTAWRFNGLGYVTQKTDALGQITKSELDPITNLTKRIIDPAGRITQYTYNQRGDLIRIIDADNKQTLIDYDLRFRKPVRIENALGHVVTMEYNNQGKLTRYTNAENETARFSYTTRGQLETITDPLDQVIRFRYDSNGNLTESINAANETTVRSYDVANRLIEITDNLSRTVRYTYDSLDRISEIQDSAQGMTRYTYDANNNLLSVIDPNNHPVERSVYDLRNRLKQRTDAKNRSTVYERDGVGNVIRMIDRKGQVTEYTYDALRRMTQIRDQDGRTTSYAYDLAGNLARASDSRGGDVLMSYDRLNRLTEVITPQGTVAFTYDAIGRRLTRTLSGGDVTTYTYDKANRLKSVTLRGKIATFGYDAAGRLIERTLPNGLTVTYQYDVANRITSITYQKPDNTFVEALTYGYDAGGQRIQRAQGTPSQQETPFTASYDEANRLTSITLAGEPFTLTYDDNGNLVSKVGPTTGATLYAWNARNQLVAVSGPYGNATFKYDAFGRRIEKTVGGITTGFLYDGSQAIAELRSGALETVYHTGIAIDEVLARYGASGNKVLLTDALMSVIAQAEDDQSVGNLYSYSPYGETGLLGPDSSNSLQYTGRENDGTGLYYYRARYYDPVLKRFISEDPLGIAGGINLYAYVAGNPISLVDPEGKILEILEPVHVMVAYGSAGIVLGTASFVVGYGIGTGIRLTTEWIIGDTIGGKIADAFNPLPPMNPPTPPASTPPAPTPPAPTPPTPTPPAPTPPSPPGQPSPPGPPGQPGTPSTPGLPPMPPAVPPNVPCWI